MAHKLMSFHIDDDKLLKKYKTIWAKIEDLKNLELNALLVYDDRYTKTKIRIKGMPSRSVCVCVYVCVCVCVCVCVREV